MSEKEYIEREALLKKAYELRGGSFSTGLIIEQIEKAPSADVVEVKHGEWTNEGEYLYKCSLCGDKAFLRLGGKPCRYCPSCGAKMDGKGD